MSVATSASRASSLPSNAKAPDNYAIGRRSNVPHNHESKTVFELLPSCKRPQRLEARLVAWAHHAMRLPTARHAMRLPTARAAESAAAE